MVEDRVILDAAIPKASLKNIYAQEVPPAAPRPPVLVDLTAYLGRRISDLEKEIERLCALHDRLFGRPLNEVEDMPTEAEPPYSGQLSELHYTVNRLSRMVSTLHVVIDNIAEV